VLAGFVFILSEEQPRKPRTSWRKQVYISTVGLEIETEIHPSQITYSSSVLQPSIISILNSIMAPDTLSLQGKVAIITGSGKENGIGAGIASALARNGAWVTINYISETTAPRAMEVAKKIQRDGGRATVVQADVSTQEGATKLVDGTLKAFGVEKIDILGASYILVLLTHVL
jgi:hypothetical protein